MVKFETSYLRVIVNKVSILYLPKKKKKYYVIKNLEFQDTFGDGYQVIQ